jgi:hypothetical protein
MEISYEIGMESQKKQELKSKFQFAYGLLKDKYEFISSQGFKYHGYDLKKFEKYNKVMTNKWLMEHEADMIIRMITYRTSEQTAKEIKRFFDKYDIGFDGVPKKNNQNTNTEIHIHIHF